MEQLTSELKFTTIDTKVPIYNLNYYKDNYTLMYEKGYTEHIGAATTRYNPAFLFYKNDGIIGASLHYYGEYTENEIHLLNNLIQPGFIVYDIGANIGYHTVGLAQTSKHVYAFEPNLKNYKLLKLNTVHNKNVTAFNLAIGREICITEISDFDLNTMGNYGECMITEEGQTCEMTTIDHLVKTKQIEPPNVVKIDVEGHEWNVVQGMTNTIKDNLPIIFYEHMHGDDLPKVHELLEQLGYEIFWFPVGNYNPNNYYKNATNVFGQGGVLNVVACPFYLNAKTNLPKKLHKDETWAEAVERLKNATQN